MNRRSKLLLTSLLLPLLFVVVSCSDDSTSPPPPPPPHGQPADDWAVNAGGGNFDYGYGAVTDSAGNVYVAGKFTGTAVFGDTTLTDNGSGDAFVAKYDKSGHFLWAVRAGGTALDDAQAIAADSSGNVYITGQFTGTAGFGIYNLVSAGSQDIYVAKLDQNGTVVWAKRAGGTSFESGIAIASDRDGNVVVTGFFRDSFTYGSTVITSAGNADVFVARYDTDGNVSWARRGGGTGGDVGEGIASDGAGGTVVSGSFEGTAQFGANTLIAAGLRDVFVVKYDVSGNVVWARRGGGTSADVPLAAATDGFGNTYVAGYFLETAVFEADTLRDAGEGDIFVVRYDSDGNVTASARAGGTEFDRGLGIAVDHSGNVFVAGCFRGTCPIGSTSLTSAGNDDIFVARFSPSLTPVWAWGTGSSGDDRGYGITTDGSGYVVSTGMFGGNVQFGQTALTSAGAADAFVFRMGPGGI